MIKKILIIVVILLASFTAFADEVIISKQAKDLLQKIEKDYAYQQVLYSLQRENIILRDFIEQKLPGWAFNGEKFIKEKEKTD